MPADAATDRSFGAFNFMIGVKDTASQELSKLSTHYDKVTKALGTASEHMKGKTTAAFTAISNSAKKFGSGMDTSSLKKKIGKGIMASKPVLEGMMTPLVGGLLAGGVTVAGSTLKKLGESFSTGKVGKGIENISMFSQMFDLTPKRMKKYAKALQGIPFLKTIKSTGVLSKALRSVPWVGRVAKARNLYLKGTGQVIEDTTTLTYQLKHLGKVLNQQVGKAINNVKGNWESWIAGLALGTAMLVALKLEDNVNAMRKHLRRGEADAAKYVDAMGVVATMTKSSFDEVTEVMVAAVNWGFRAREGLEEFAITAIKLGKVTGMSGTEMAAFTYKLRDMYGVSKEAIPGVVGGIKSLADASAASFGDLIEHLDKASTYMLRLQDTVTGSTAVAISALAATSESFWIDPSNFISSLNEMTKVTEGEFNLLRSIIGKQIGKSGPELREALLAGGPDVVKETFTGYIKAIQAIPERQIKNSMNMLTERYQTTENNILKIRKGGTAALIDLEKNFQESLMQAQRAKEMEKLYSDTMGTLTKAFGGIYAAFKGVLASLGAPLMIIIKYTLVPMAQAVSWLAEVFQSLSPWVKTIISYITVLGAVTASLYVNWLKARLVSWLWGKSLGALISKVFGVTVAEQMNWVATTKLGRAYIWVGKTSKMLMTSLFKLMSTMIKTSVLGVWALIKSIGKFIVTGDIAATKAMFMSTKFYAMNKAALTAAGSGIKKFTLALWSGIKAIAKFAWALMSSAAKAVWGFVTSLGAGIVATYKLIVAQTLAAAGGAKKFVIAMGGMAASMWVYVAASVPTIAALWAMAVAGWAAIAPFLPFIAIGAAVIAIIAGIVYAFMNWDKVLGKVTEWFSSFKEWALEMFRKLSDTIRGFFADVYSYLRSTPVIGHLITLVETLFSTDKMRAFWSAFRRELEKSYPALKPIFKLYDIWDKRAGDATKSQKLLEDSQKALKANNAEQYVALRKQAAKAMSMETGRSVADMEKQLGVSGDTAAVEAAIKKSLALQLETVESRGRKEMGLKAGDAFDQKQYAAFGVLRQLSMQAKSKDKSLLEWMDRLGPDNVNVRRITDAGLTLADIEKYSTSLATTGMVPGLSLQHGGYFPGDSGPVMTKFHGPEMVRPLTPGMTEGMDAALDMAKASNEGSGSDLVLDGPKTVKLLTRMVAIMEKYETEADITAAFGAGGKGGLMGSLKALAVRGFDT